MKAQLFFQEAKVYKVIFANTIVKLSPSSAISPAITFLQQQMNSINQPI
ncbi:6363_t:CDS:2 [Racocetra fulgida]|uniref:6363_t:CDS:1 n=1 Tax=Racocetra fulgida TaxID=60492 RepID=A0A9N9AEU0_9GLOM|nr:6363_t:CDS:2 [Racocetra fulgida]